jgi:hypothetical protein
METKIDKTSFKQAFYNPKKNKLSLLFTLKHEENFEVIFSIFKEILNHPLVRAFVFSNPFPKKLADLRKSKMLPNSGNFVEN